MCAECPGLGGAPPGSSTKGLGFATVPRGFLSNSYQSPPVWPLGDSKSSTSQVEGLGTGTAAFALGAGQLHGAERGHWQPVAATARTKKQIEPRIQLKMRCAMSNRDCTRRPRPATSVEALSRARWRVAQPPMTRIWTVPKVRRRAALVSGRRSGTTPGRTSAQARRSARALPKRYRQWLPPCRGIGQAVDRWRISHAAQTAKETQYCQGERRRSQLMQWRTGGARLETASARRQLQPVAAGRLHWIRWHHWHCENRCSATYPVASEPRARQ